MATADPDFFLHADDLCGHPYLRIWNKSFRQKPWSVIDVGSMAFPAGCHFNTSRRQKLVYDLSVAGFGRLFSTKIIYNTYTWTDPKV